MGAGIASGPRSCGISSEENVPAENSSPITQPSRAAVILEICVGVVFTAAAGYIALAMPGLVRQEGMQEAQTFLHLSPVFFPQLSFALTCLISALFLVQAARRLPPAGRVAGGTAKEKYWNVAIMCVLIIVYGLLLPLLGFGFATLLALGVTSYALGTRSWWQLAAYSIVTPVIIRFIFERVLYISLPLSPIEFLTNFEQGLMKFLVVLFMRG